MADHPAGFFQGTEMPTAGWWEALWPDPAVVLTAVGLRPGMDVIDLCSGDGWFTLQITKVARHVSAIDIDPNNVRYRFGSAPLLLQNVIVCSKPATSGQRLLRQSPEGTRWRFSRLEP
jgi:16S rRNA C967 or C1407 C5-methylase (RsmB/RsmF family)